MKKIGKNILMAGAALACVSLLPVGVALSAPVGGSEAGFVDVNVAEFVAESRLVGDKVTLPDMKYSDGDSQTEADCVLYYPDGQGYTGEEATLTQRGQYTLVYSAEVNGKRMETRKSFVVSQAVYSMSSSKSTLNFGKASDYSAYEAAGKSGIVASIARGSTFDYNRIIDMKGRTKEDTICTFSVLPQTIGTADSMKIVLTFTDSTDPSNYVDVIIKMCGTGVAWKEQYSYATANAVGQPQQGLEARADHNASRATFLYDGNYYVRHVNDVYGSGFGAFSQSGMVEYDKGANPSLVGTQDCAISFDYERRAVYANGAIICDLDEPTLQSVLWNGFADDKCYLSIGGDGFNASSLNLLITEIDGDRTFQTRTFSDDEAPEIAVSDEAMNATKYAVVGQPYRVPEATAFDVYDLDRAVDVKVYKAYGSSAQSLMPIGNGCFTPTQERTYTLVYTAEDGSGNTAQKIYEIDAVSTTEKISLSYGSPVTTGVVGQEFTIATPAVSDENGKYGVKVSVEGAGKSVEVATLTEETIAQALKFRPMQSGKYTVKYEYSDYIFTETAEYEVEISPDGDPIVSEEAVMPRYFIKNATYEVPALNGYEFVDGKASATKATVYITRDGNYADAEAYTAATFKATEAGTYYFTYVLGGNVKTYAVSCVDVGYLGVVGNNKNVLDRPAYFAGYQSYEATDSSVTYTLKQNSAGAYTLDFINEVQTFDFAFDLRIPETVNYTGFEVTLSDADALGNELKATFLKSAQGRLVCRLNGGRLIEVDDTFEGTDVKVQYNAKTGIVTVQSVFTFPVESNFAGEAWTGFTDHRAWLSVGVLDATAAPEMTVVAIGTQFFGTPTTDRPVPDVTLPDTFGEFMPGDKVVIEGIHFADVLSPEVSATLTVTAPSGQVVTSTDGVTLENVTDVSRSYEITLTEYGVYNAQFIVTDAHGRRNFACSYQFTVADTVAPTVTVSEGTKTGKVGSAIKIASVTVKDNISSADACSAFYYVQSPDGAIEKVYAVGDDAMKFTPQKAGVYTVWYYVYDEAGNVAMASYQIEVK